MDKNSYEISIMDLVQTEDSPHVLGLFYIDSRLEAPKKKNTILSMSVDDINIRHRQLVLRSIPLEWFFGTDLDI
jgi:hypothetical protein